MAKPKLTKRELKALVDVRAMLANGVLEYGAAPDSSKWYSREFFAMGLRKIFNMSLPAKATECGSVACIGGWMGAMMGMSPQEASYFVADYEEHGKFSELFYPTTISYDYEEIKPAHAVKAIDSFLRTGNPNWKRAMKAKSAKRRA